MDLFKLLNDTILMDPSENIIKTNPKTKITLLYFMDSNWFLDFITKQLAIKPEIII